VRRKYDLRIAHIEQALETGPKSVRALVAALFPKVTSVNVFLAFWRFSGS